MMIHLSSIKKKCISLKIDCVDYRNLNISKQNAYSYNIQKLFNTYMSTVLPFKYELIK